MEQIPSGDRLGCFNLTFRGNYVNSYYSVTVRSRFPQETDCVNSSYSVEQTPSGDRLGCSILPLEERGGLVVECLTSDRGVAVPAAREALHCVLEQDTLSSA